MLSVIAISTLLQTNTTLSIQQGLAVSGIVQSSRSPSVVDPILAAIVEGKWTKPTTGTVAGRGTWKAVQSGTDGTFPPETFRSGYFFATVTTDRPEVRILNGSGYASVLVNGVPRMGDLYAVGYVHTPIALQRGENQLLFSSSRGPFRANLSVPRASAMLEVADATMPDILRGKAKVAGAVVVINAQDSWRRDLSIQAKLGSDTVESRLPAIPPLSMRKVRVEISVPSGLALGEHEASLQLRERGQTLDSAAIRLKVVEPANTHKQTFLSSIDGSVQYYAVVPATNVSNDNALVLTLHGASVEASGQAAAYQAKEFATLVAPTNRRPFGFDWEDWGRIDALEVLSLARTQFPHDPNRLHVTGHSMGGHGTWHLGTLRPDLWASVNPSAGWISFWSYAGGYQPGDSPIEILLRRAMNSSDTLGRLENLRGKSSYILHGDADDNVPVAQARTMRRELTRRSIAHRYHEQPGAGHWWGNECVDWPELFASIRSSRRNDDLDRLHFVTANPAISARSGWVTIHQQNQSLAFSTVSATRSSSSVSITTNNVRTLGLDAKAIPNETRLTIDGESVPKGSSAKWLYQRQSNQWRLISSVPAEEKDAFRGGPFKEAFQKRMVFVVGTSGTEAENAWAFAKARYDAEQWYVRGNGAVDIVPDRLLSYSNTRQRNIVLYGHGAMNSAYSRLVGHAPIRVWRSNVRVGTKQFSSEDLAVLFVYPKRENPTSMVAVVAGSGMVGMRLTDRLPYFISGVAYPDWTVLEPEAIRQGPRAIVGTGFFDARWQLKPNDLAWSKGP
jgi:poly(3-hydroxybutyrate) depolymerase